ncbi:2-amino-4-hydroxy-6-hydroxymethyldihydropteridine diphosphokinase [Lysobacter humi (ex Lee et al. 2017)]
MPDAVQACIGLGANLGDAARAVRDAAVALGDVDGIVDVRLSPLYRTPAWGVTDQPDFVNAVALLRTVFTPRALLDVLLDLERAAGRDRASAMPWGPRVLDLDLLLYGDSVVDEPGLHVPHPRMHERAFVLVPLHALAPETVVPGRGRVDALLRGVETARIEAIR